MKIDWKDLWTRAYKTFIQAFLSSLSLGLAGVTLADANVSTLATLGISAAVAGLAALFSFLGNWIASTGK